jgi:hypothetical protein
LATAYSTGPDEGQTENDKLRLVLSFSQTVKPNPSF